MANVILRVKREDGSWAEIPALVGPEGPQGVSIDDIVLKSQEGGVSTYLILLSDGSEKTFQVTDGAIITDVSLINTNVLIDTYRISISDGSYFDFKVTNGRGIKSIAKTSTDVLSDTYTISYNDNTSSTFKVTNGRSIKSITKSQTDVLTDTYTISYNDNTTSTYTITNGRGIDYIEKDQTIGISDRYTIHYNDGTTSYYHVVNGEAGPAGSIGNRIYLSGVVDKVNDETGYERVKELKTSKFDKSKFTVVGSPLISDDGVASGFSDSDYINFAENFLFRPGNSTWEIITKIKTPTTLSEREIVLGFCPQVNANRIGLYILLFNNHFNILNSYDGISWAFHETLNGGQGTHNFLLNTDYYLKYSFTGDYYILSYSFDGINYTEDIRIKSSNYTYNNYGASIIGRYGDLKRPFHGSINLKSFSISVDGKEVFSGNPTAIDTIKDNNYTTTGSPTISSDGIFKANASGDSLYRDGFSTEIKKELRCDGRFYYKTKDLNDGNALVLANSTVYWNISSAGLIRLTDGTNTSTVQIEIPLKDGDIFDTEIIYNASTITLNVCLNEGVNYTTSIASQGLTTFNTWRLSYNENYWGGTIDLNTIHVYVDGNLVYQPCLKIPYTKAKTGSKIVDAAWKLRVEDCYNQYGAGNYYLFSLATEQFALPMPDIYGLIQTLDERWDSIQIADTDLSNLTEQGIKVIKDNSGSGLEVCDIGMALYVDETKGLRRYLNGQIVERNDNTEAFFTRLQEITTLHPSLLCTEDEWQTAKTMSAFGQVGKFVFNYDDISTYVVIKPLVNSYIKITPIDALDTLQVLPSGSMYCGTPTLSSDGTHIKVSIYRDIPFTISATGYKTTTITAVADDNNQFIGTVELEKDETNGGTESGGTESGGDNTEITGEQVIVSVRIPRVVNVQGLFDLQNLGLTVGAGLPNITGGIGAGIGDRASGSGAFKKGSGSGAAYGGSSYAMYAFDFDASRCSSIYGNSDTVQQEAIQYPYFIQIATGSETENNIVNDIELNNPYSLFDSKYSPNALNNLSWLKSEGQWNSKAVYPTAYDKLLKVYNGTETVEGLSVKLSTEEYTDYDFVLNTADETFRLPLRNGTEGMFGNIPVVGNGMTLGLTNGTNNAGLHAWSNAFTFIPSTGAYGTPVGTESTGNTPNGQLDYGVTTDPTKSGLITDLSSAVVPDGWKLYYYVGETVQNANLIDAGRIGEQLVGKADTDLTNTVPSTAFIQQSTSWGIPDYNSGISLPVTVGSTYTPTTDGVLQVNRVHTNQERNSSITVLIDGVSVVKATGYNDYSAQFGVSIYVYIGKGSLMQITENNTNGSSITFFPLKGAN